MEYDENIIYKLKNQIKEQINNFEYSKEIVDKLYESFKSNERLIADGAILEIKNNEIIIEYMGLHEKKRISDIIQLIKKSINYIKKKKMNFPNTKLFLFISDVYAYFEQDLPLFVLAKPKNKKGILIPDNTFQAHTNINKKFETWEQIKKKFFDLQTPLNKKKDVLFFIGANTDENRQDIRANLNKLSNGKTVNNISIDKKKLPLEIEFSHNRDLSEFSKFKYLLNLPGKQPWSYRFKYLFLAKSLVINVNVHQKYDCSDIINDTWINFFDIIFEPNFDYIDLVFHWFCDDPDYNNYEFKKLISNLEITYDYYNTNPLKYEQMVNSGYKKVLNITEDLICESIFLLTHYYSKKINPFL
jgi:hypothetical protein